MKAKKILALLLTILLLTGLMPQIVLADTGTIDLSTVSESGTGYTCEAITVNSKTVSILEPLKKYLCTIKMTS